MRLFNCFVSIIHEGKVKASHTNACWSMLSQYWFFWLTAENVPNGWHFDEILISQFDEPETRGYQSLLVNIINDITPCAFEIHNGSRYIKYKMLVPPGLKFENYVYSHANPIPHDAMYEQNLVLLHFIRYLWNQPVAGFTKRFFQYLELCDYPDPLSRLTWTNQSAVKDCCSPYSSPGHSAIHPGLIIKKKDQLLNWSGGTCTAFLTK